MPPETRYAKSGDVNIASRSSARGHLIFFDKRGTGMFDRIVFADRGERELKGVGSCRLYSVLDA